MKKLIKKLEKEVADNFSNNMRGAICNNCECKPKVPVDEDGLIEGISFDEITHVGISAPNRTFNVPTVYSYMNNYMNNGFANIDEILNYPPNVFVMYIKSYKSIFENRVVFLFSNLSAKLNSNIKEINKEITSNSDADIDEVISPRTFVFSRDNLYSMIYDINTYVMMVLSGIGEIERSSEMYEVLSMEYASLLMNDMIEVYQLPESEKEIQYLYAQILDAIFENSKEFVSILYKLCYEEPFVQRYIELLDMYNKKNGFIPEELKIK